MMDCYRLLKAVLTRLDKIVVVVAAAEQLVLATRRRRSLIFCDNVSILDNHRKRDEDDSACL